MGLLSQAFEYLTRRRTAYVKTFNGPVAREVLADLAKFCRARESCFYADPRAHAAAEGRREVWLRIQNHIRLSDEQLWELHVPGALKPPQRSSDDNE